MGKSVIDVRGIKRPNSIAWANRVVNAPQTTNPMFNVKTILSRPHPASVMTVSRRFTGVSLPPSRIVHPTNEAEVTKCVWTLATAFDKVPCTNAFSAESGQTVLNYVDKTIRHSIGANGVLVEAANASAVALWELPAFHPIVNIVPQTPYRSLGIAKQEWKQTVQQAKIKYIGTDMDPETGGGMFIRPHYHLDFLARNPHTPKTPGAISAVVVPYLARANQDQLSVWLEATSLDVVPLYQHFGFRVVEEITIGVGRVDEQGRLKQGGEGVKAWLMLVDNHESS